jgi:arylsulfatase A-like enzyme
MSISRRDFIVGAAGVACGAQTMSIPSALAQPNATASNSRANFIFVVTDDQRFDALSVVQRELGADANFPWFKTPHLDRLAVEGARFRNAFVVQSLCSPSRANFLTGLHSHAHGVVHNDIPFPATLTTWASELSKAGYATGYFGKWHMGTQRERPGFGTVFTYTDQGVYENCPFIDNGRDVPSDGWVDDVTTDAAIRFIEARRSTPFAMVVGYKTPHDPRHPPERHKNLYADAMFIKPVNAEVTPPFRRQDQRRPWREKSEDRLNYFRCLQAVDDNVGRLLDALDRTGLARSTVVVFVGDNGYYFGEHGLGDKRSLYEESIRIPLLVRYPDRIRPGTIIDAPALNIDLAPTFLDLAGVRIPDSMHGKSWVPLLDGQTDNWRASFLCASYVDPAYPDVTFESVAVRTETAKLIVYPGHDEWTELYDLKADPHEMRNLASDAGSSELMRVMRAALDAEKRRSGYRRVN